MVIALTILCCCMVVILALSITVCSTKDADVCQGAGVFICILSVISFACVIVVGYYLP